MMTRARGTALGGVAIAGWSCYGVLLASDRQTGPFLTMAIVFTFATLTLLLWRLARGEGVSGLLPLPLTTLGLGFTGLFGSNILYVVALHMGGEPVAVNIASLSWPVFMALFIAMFRVAPTGWLDGVAIAVGFAGVLLLATGEGGFSVDWPILPAVLGAICWAALSALRTRVPEGPGGVVLHFALACTLVTWPAALLVEGASLPPPMELLRLAAVGILPVGLANQMWDIATRHGNPVLLASLSFAEPIMSTALISWILWQPVTWREGAALLLVLLAVLASVVSQRRRSAAAAA